MHAPIKNNSGENLDYSFTPGAAASHKAGWIVILGHGVTGDKERPLIIDTAAALQQAGFDTLAFSFAGNGASEGDFREATITKEVADLNSVITTASKDYSNVCYIGHSMGAAVGVIQAAQDSRIKALVSLAGMVDTKTFYLTEFGDEIPDKGRMWEEPDCPLSSAFMTDLCETVHNVSPQAEAITIPWLLVHGTADDVVLPRDTECIQKLKGDRVETRFIEGADHSFNDPSHKTEATSLVVSWLSSKSAQH